MKEIEINIDKAGLEKKIIISSGIISFDKKENSITSKYKLSTIVIAGNGDYAPPFTKGSKVLRDIRESSGKPIDNWKLIIPLQQKESDFFFVKENNPEKISNFIVDLISNRLNKAYHFNPVLDIQVLCPVHKGMIGTIEINQKIQNTLNPLSEKKDNYNYK